MMRVYRLLLIVILGAALLSNAAERAGVVWTDSDMKDIEEPKDHRLGYYENLFDAQFMEPLRKYTDMPRWLRAVIRQPKAAANVNDLDEVPTSSWYTNRHHLHRMTVPELVRGPNQAPAPDFSRVTVTNAKLEGVTPGLQLKDAKGVSYLVKFDSVNYPELQSSAEVISTKILYASGYNVPENYIAFIDPHNIDIAPDVKIAEPPKGERPLTANDLLKMFGQSAQSKDGRYRVLASKMLSGTAKGPFPQVGVRSDDPNDRIPHEHRRELRGLRVIASWINHWDTKELNSLDMYVEEDGRRFLRHYLIDFGSTLGAAATPTEYFHGRDLALDGDSVLTEILTLGFATTPGEKHAALISPAVGSFSADDFDPEDWTPIQPSIPFDNMTLGDAFWATRIILSFSEDEIRSIVKTGEYSNLTDEDHIVATLLKRRSMIARYWLSKVNPIADFSITRESQGPVLSFRDVMVDSQFAAPGDTVYKYEIKNKDRKSPTNITRRPLISLDDWIDTAGPVEVSIWTEVQGKKSDRVRVYLDPIGNGRSLIRRIAR